MHNISITRHTLTLSHTRQTDRQTDRQTTHSSPRGRDHKFGLQLRVIRPHHKALRVASPPAPHQRQRRSQNRRSRGAHSAPFPAKQARIPARILLRAIFPVFSFPLKSGSDSRQWPSLGPLPLLWRRSRRHLVELPNELPRRLRGQAIRDHGAKLRVCKTPRIHVCEESQLCF